MSGGADSAGVPWAGRRFGVNPHQTDDGSAPEAFMVAIERFRAGESGPAEVVDSLRQSRVLVPLVAELGESGTNERGQQVDKSQELSIVTVEGPDGRAVMPVFSSVAAMGRWNPAARPVPASVLRVALAAAGEGTALVVVDATSPSEFVVRRPALWAIAQERSWQPPWADAELAAEFERSTALEPAVTGVRLAPGDADARLAGPELEVELSLMQGLDREALDGLLARLSGRWAQSELIAERVDSMQVGLVQAT